jgi:hypothetical protein
MSVQIEAISRQCIELLKLEQQMKELLALRRALCLLNAARCRPKGSRRLYGASARSARRTSCTEPSQKRVTDVSPLRR